MKRLPLSLRDLAIGASFVALWLNLHVVASAFETAPGVSAWYPARGLSLALLIIFGLRFAPAVFVASLLGGIPYHLPAHPIAWFWSALTITGAMTTVAWFIRRDALRSHLGGALTFIVASALGEVPTALGIVGINAMTGLTPLNQWSETAIQFFVGDYLGILIVVPPLRLIAAEFRVGHAFARLRRFLARGKPSDTLEIAGVAAICLVLLSLVFRAQRADHFGSLQFGYLLLLPMAWAAVRFAPLGARLMSAALSIGIVVAVRLGGHRVEQVDLQLLMMSLCVVVLMLSDAVADGRRAAESLASALRAQAEDAHRETQASRLSKARFIAATTHDLQPPFEALRLGLETLAMLPLENDARQLVEQSQSACGALGRVVHSVLDISRLEGELRSARPRRFLLREVLTSVARHAVLTRPNASELIRVRCSPQLHVVADPVLLERVLANLLSNGLRATRASGRIVIGVRRVGALAVRLEVHDSGHGMQDARMRGLFEAFSNEGAQGVGIGLSLVQEVAAEMGWGLKVRSRSGAGSSFSVELPLAANSFSPSVRVDAARDAIIGVAIGRRALREVVVATLADWGAAPLAGGSADELDRTLQELGAQPRTWIVDEVTLPYEEARRGLLHRIHGSGALELPITRALCEAMSTVD